MSIIFKIAKPRQVFKQQLSFLEERSQKANCIVFRKGFVALFIATISYLLFYFLTKIDHFITLKGIGMMMIAIGWFAFCIAISVYVVTILKSKQRLRKFIDYTTDEQLTYSVQIDEEKVSIVSSSGNFEFPWTEFDCFGINGETLYIFNSTSRHNSLYWDRSEMGIEPYSALHELLKKKSISQAF